MSRKSISKPKILLCDIETAPNIAYVWALFDQNISTEQLVQAGHVLCVSWKWLGEKACSYLRVAGNEAEALGKLREVLNVADIVIHYNGTKFDIPTLHRELLLLNLPPPSPLKQIDLLRVVRKQFKFTSNKLDYVCQQLGLGNKVKHKGMALWTECMANDKAAWKIMKEYNIHDVILLEKLYKCLIPWIPNHPNLTLYTGRVGSCPRCSSTAYQKRGTYHSGTLSYQRYQCTGCKGWFKGLKATPIKVVHTPVN